MIVFERLWETMKRKNVSQYALIKEFKVSTGQLDRLRKNAASVKKLGKNENVNTYTLNRLCEILDCELDDIAEYKKL